MNARSLSPLELGGRLREARRARGISQEVAAEELKMSRPTLIAIEKGRRPASPRELIVLARLYGRTIHELTRAIESVRPLAASFRAAGEEVDPDSMAVIAELERLAGDVAEVETVTQVHMPRAYPDVYDIAGLAPEAAADQIATSERQRLGLGDAAISNLRDILENEVGIKVFCFEMPSQIAGLFAVAEPAGACIGVNAKHPFERQRWTLAHEYGHFLTKDRWSTEVTRLEISRPRIAEKFAEAFAARFLMPSTSVVRRFQLSRRGRGGNFAVPDLLQMAALFQTSVQALAIRLEDLGLVAGGWFHEDVQPRLHVREAQRRLGIEERRSDLELLPRRIQYVAVGAYLNGEISEGVLARLFRADRLSTREIVDRLVSSVDLNAVGEPNIWTLGESTANE